MKCPFCNSENMNDAVFCANCGASIAPKMDQVPQNDTAPYEYGQTPQAYYQPSYSYEPASDPRDKKAVAGIVLGIASLPCCFISLFTSVSMGVIMLIICASMGIVGIIMSVAGLKSTNRRGMAIAGLVCAILGTLMAVGCIILIAIGIYAIQNLGYLL